MKLIWGGGGDFLCLFVRESVCLLVSFHSMMTAAATIQAVLRPGDRVLEPLRWQNFDTPETLAGKTAQWVGRLVAQLLVLFSRDL